MNILIVSTTAIITVFICLLPQIIYEKKLVLESINRSLRTGSIEILQHNYQPQQKTADSQRQFEDMFTRLSSQEADSIRTIRYVIIAISALIILNQSVAVYGLFKERSNCILISTVIIALIGQIGIFTLPASIFVLITIYLIFSFAYVIVLNHLNRLSNDPTMMMALTRSPSRASSIEPQLKSTMSGDCCRCRSCFCSQQPFNSSSNQFQSSPPTTAMKFSRKKSYDTNDLYQNIPYYHGSLGRKSTSKSIRASSNQSGIRNRSDNFYELYQKSSTPTSSIYRNPIPGKHSSRNVQPTTSMVDTIINKTVNRSQQTQDNKDDGVDGENVDRFEMFERAKDTTIM